MGNAFTLGYERGLVTPAFRCGGAGLSGGRRGNFGLAVHLRHLLLVVARPGHLLQRERRVELGHLPRAERHGRAAPTLSSRWRRRLVPGIGTMSGPLCSCQASAICPRGHPFRAASSRTLEGLRELLGNQADGANPGAWRERLMLNKLAFPVGSQE
jgi:hypothetical protein